MMLTEETPVRVTRRRIDWARLLWLMKSSPLTMIGGVIIVIASPIKLIIFVIMIVCIQQVDGLLIGPRIIGSTTGLKPVWVVFSITVGGALFGVIGMFLGVPVFAVLSYLLNITVQHFLDKRKVTVQPYDSPDDL